MTLHIFNPSHDEALAINRSHYCPSAAARRTAEKHWDVAQLWAAPGDIIVRLPADGSVSATRFYRDLAPVERIDWDIIDAIEPWGWDRHIVGVLRRLGAPERLLPSDNVLDHLRQLSSRQTTTRLINRLQQLPPIAGVIEAQSYWCTTEAEAHAAIARCGGQAVVKQPWSCSGRGVWRTDSTASAQRIAKTLREQGAVEVEPLYERTADFAMEFQADSTIHYLGLSLFATHESGAYAGNDVASEDELRARLEALASPSLLALNGGHLPLEALATRLAETLESLLASHYSGPLGIDMMLTPQGVHPCIEVNLRNTMGRVAIMQHRRALTT